MHTKQKAENDEMIPLKFHLSQNYPNPFKEKTRIKYCLAYKTEATITIFNSEGELVERLLREEQEAGTYEIEFDASICHSGESRNLPEGIYFYKLEAGGFIGTKKMILQK